MASLKEPTTLSRRDGTFCQNQEKYSTQGETHTENDQQGRFQQEFVWPFPQVEYTREQAAHILKVLKNGRGSLDVNSFEDEIAADF